LIALLSQVQRCVIPDRFGNHLILAIDMM